MPLSRKVLTRNSMVDTASPLGLSGFANSPTLSLPLKAKECLSFDLRIHCVHVLSRSYPLSHFSAQVEQSAPVQPPGHKHVSQVGFGVPYVHASLHLSQRLPDQFPVHLHRLQSSPA